MNNLIHRLSKLYQIKTQGLSLDTNCIDTLSSKLANLLQSCSKEGLNIGVYMSKSPCLVISILAILKDNLTYVPLDKAFPSSRLNYIISDASIHLILTDDLDHAKKLNCNNIIQIRTLDDITALENIDDHPRRTQQFNENLMIRYTSGSTGNPKGVLVTHACVDIRLKWIKSYYNHSTSDVYCLKTNLAFADSVLEIFSPLIMGNTLFIPDEKSIYKPDIFCKLMIKYKLTTLYVVPTFLNIIFRYAIQTKLHFPDIKYIMIGGEPLSTETIDYFYQICPNGKLINFYGLTEVGGAIFYDTSQRLHDKTERSPVGIPLPYVEALILDKKLKPTKPGVKGELFIGGEGLTKGYLNLTEVQPQKFISHPEKKSILFRTGDIFLQKKEWII
jgi:non-ribosomal peptide synthetase component F